MAEYDRYYNFRNNGKINIVPFIEIDKKKTDINYIFNLGRDRLDLISNSIYGSPDYGWLILQANPQVGAYEFLIPDQEILRIPYPLNTTLEMYQNRINNFIELYGLE